jgi:uncharacterized cupredoxin-like copper-binding protein
MIFVEKRPSCQGVVILVAALALLAVVGCGADPPDAPTISTLADFSIKLTSTPVHAGTNQFIIRNKGGEEHELVGFKIDQPVADLALTPDGDLDEDVLTKVSDGDNLPPRTNSKRAVELTAPGTYLFVCNLPGHFRRGMYTTATLP